MTSKKQIIEQLTNTIAALGVADAVVRVDYPTDPKHGDYASNIALVTAKKLGKNPMEVASEIKTHLEKQDVDWIKTIEIVKPGFINFWIENDTLISSLKSLDSDLKIETPLSGKKLLVEYAHPNTHKAFHIGHLRNIIVGECVVRLLNTTGATVIRTNYQGDVGMHIAKCLYGMLHNPEFAIKNVGSDIKERVEFLGKAYAAGSKAFEEEADAKKAIGEINKKIYAKDSSIMELYQMTRQWSLDYFEMLYKRLGSHFDRYYFESEIFETGKEKVVEGLEKGVFQKSNGAIIFPGAKYGFHDRVFITSEGNPTYEGKEMGLGPLQFKEHNPDLIIHVVGPEQAGYFQVVFEALAQLFPETRGKEYHLAYGWVKLKHGKMSSRTGNVILGEWLINEAKKKIYDILEKNGLEYTSAERKQIAENVAIGAVKYSFLRVSTQQEIAFDLEESVSFEGNSGPYLQYTYARTQSVLRKSEMVKVKSEKLEYKILQPEERELLQLINRFSEVVGEAAMRYAPNVLCAYLFQVAQAFNLFYQKHPILKQQQEVQAFRLFLTSATGSVIKQGLDLLGIQTPERM